MEEQEKEILNGEQNPGEMPEGEDSDKETATEETVGKEASDEEAGDDKTTVKEETKDTAEDGEQEEIAGDEEKKLFGKNKKKDKKEEAFKQKIDELEDRVKRQMAEFENFRKRTEKEKSAMYEVGARSVIEKILPVVDNFERGLAAIPEEEKGSAFADGMNMIYKQLTGELDKLGVKPIEAVGKEFNPEFHNAVMQVESEEYEPGIVAQELQKGYTYHDTVVRHSMVAVTQ